jgi:riboflavin biosynthesis pyrimidine reductase
MATSTILALPTLEPLYETPELPEFELPAGLADAYGGPLGFAEPRLYANFVASLDGVVALPGELQSNRIISGHSEADRFVMGLLRSCADAVLVGAGTMRGSPQTRWTAEHAYPPAARLFGELRRSRRLSARPTLAVLSGGGSLDPRHPALEEGALVLTSERGAARLRGRLPSATTILAIGGEAPIDLVAAVKALRERGHELLLSEGGPTAFGALVAAGLADELFLTTSPLLAGRSPGSSRPALVENAEFLPATTVECKLLTLRRAGSQLFLRYQLSGPERRVSSFSPTAMRDGRQTSARLGARPDRRRPATSETQRSPLKSGSATTPCDDYARSVMASDTTKNWRQSSAILGATLGVLVVLLIFFLLSDMTDAVRYGVGALLAGAWCC